MHNLEEIVYTGLGLSNQAQNLTMLQITLRGVIVFCASLIMVRLGDRRSLAQKSAFDLVLLVVVGSVLARAINGTAAVVRTLGASLGWPSQRPAGRAGARRPLRHEGDALAFNYKGRSGGGYAPRP